MNETVTPTTSAAPAWLYMNDARLVTSFLGAAMIVLGIGLLVTLTYGADEAATEDVLLGIGVFILLFAVLLFLPRLRSRGPMSFSLLVERPMDTVVEAVTGAVEETGRKVRVEVLQARLELPPRTILVEGLAWRFSLRDAPYRERGEEGTRWTEVVQTGLDDEKDEVARELRERVASRLATSTVAPT